ncbi:hypothetical protein H4Q26_014318 [Puccinia striiformis f. sp. tritici PST-130]|nr:hypothetical protein Pst134EB_012839 [Puccinia striiformis f. sp. tritici]KAI9619552.1 hypothetical protein H4Q26_014318 [Puccinia striiformis f. sp. tritici PST-130]
MDTYGFSKMSSGVESTPFTTRSGSAGTAEYDFIRMIGEGTTSQVWLVNGKKRGEACALKAIRINETEQEEEGGIRKMVANELKSLRRLDRRFPFVAHLISEVQEGTTVPGWFFVPLEYVPGGNLCEHILSHGPIGESRTRLYAAELGCALDHLHSRGIIFRDLKTENILIGHDGHLKITDFGLSTIPNHRRGRASSICGTPHTIAPEIVRREEYDNRVDWYSLGSCLFECLDGQSPFASLAVDLPALIHSVIYRDPRLPKSLSPNCKTLLRALLAKDPDNRISSIDELLIHPWFVDPTPSLSTDSFSKDRIINKLFKPLFVPECSPTPIPISPLNHYLHPLSTFSPSSPSFSAVSDSDSSCETLPDPSTSSSSSSISFLLPSL